MSKKNVEPEYWLPPVFDGDGVQSSSGIGVDGKEYPDPVPMAPPIGYTAPPNIMDMIRSMVRSEELKRKLDAEGFETFEEADDFDIEDDPLDPLTPYEKIFYPEEERSAPGPNGMAGPQAGKGVAEAAPAVAAPSETPVKGAEGAVASPPPVKSEKAA